MADSAASWQSRPEAGTRLAMDVMAWIARHLGRRTLQLIVIPVSVYFYFVRTPERRASFAYLTRVFGRPARTIEVMKHFLSFARVTADRFYFLTGQETLIPVKFVVDPKLEEILQSGKSGIFLAAHFGSFEAARVVGPAIGGINLRIVLDKAVNGRLLDLMAEVDPTLHNLIIDSAQKSAQLGLEIRDTLKQGDWVGFLADRHRAADRTVSQNFLGSPAKFPLGPYIIASVFKAPVIGAFCRLTDAGYEVHLETLSQSVTAPRKMRQQIIDQLCADYVARLERHVRASPYGWFNFYDFWGD